MNNFRHGFTGVFRVLPWESREEFHELHDALRDEHRPSTVTETILVDKMAQSLWLSKRAACLQEETFHCELPKCTHPRQLALYMRYQTTNDRAFHRCLNELLKLRAAKRKTEIGSESQLQKQAAETRKQERHKLTISLAEAKLERHLSQKSAPAHSEPRAQQAAIPMKIAA